MLATKPILFDEMKKIFSYDKESGVVRWDDSRRKSKAGKVAGYTATGSDGRLNPRVKIGQCEYILYRIAWCLGNGKDVPQGMVIDHINGDTTDNRLENLRCTTIQVNTQNLRSAKGNTRSGLLGVVPTKWGRWSAQIKADGKNLYLGTFDSKEKAHEEYVKAKRRLHDGCTI